MLDARLRNMKDTEQVTFRWGFRKSFRAEGLGFNNGGSKTEQEEINQKELKICSVQLRERDGWIALIAASIGLTVSKLFLAIQ